ncbi:hypothetical protein [Nostoc sp.]
MPWTAGERLQAGKYVIDKVLGQGGFGITYKALHVELNRTVVIKTPNEYLSHDLEYEKYIERFIQEGRTLAHVYCLAAALYYGVTGQPPTTSRFGLGLRLWLWLDMNYENLLIRLILL